MAASSTFGTVLTEQMAVARWEGGGWSAAEVVPLAALSIHPAAHALHYGSSCFEGLKAHRGVDGVVRIFRLDRHIARLQQSAEVLVLPVPAVDLVAEMVVGLVRAVLPATPESPGSLYLRPTLIGTEANIGAAGYPSSEALLFVLASPVGDYFAGGGRPLVLDIESGRPRTGPGFGKVKTGANYVMALGPTLRAAAKVGADQILFAPDGRVEETGASNFLLIDGERVVTPALTDGFLHGVTRDALLVLADDLGLQVEERTVTVDEVLDWAARPDAEAALSGTAAVLAPVGELVLDGRRTTVGSGKAGPHTARLRETLTDVQTARRPDPHGWLTPVEP
jgi:branched-chain amino acid aminotransferase